MAGERGSNFIIYNNDGTERLYIDPTYIEGDTRFPVTIKVTDTGVAFYSDLETVPYMEYRYSGNKKFLGFAITANATTPVYTVGYIGTSDDEAFADCFGGGTDIVWYIVEEMNTVTFDLSTLNLSAGTHEITVKARASGYLDSPASNAVNYVVAEETTYKLSGTWKFNEKINTVFIGLEAYDVRFVNDGIEYDGMLSEDNGNMEFDTGYYYTEDGDYEIDHVYSSYDDVWLYEDGRIITFDGEQTVSKEFYEWFTANATLQSGEEIPDTPTEQPTQGLAYTLSSDGTYYTCTGIGTATDTDIVIASEIDGIPVTEINPNAFRECSSLTSVVIPDSVTRINDAAFRECSSLTSVVIPDSVTYIGNGAFWGCTSLTSVEIGDSVETIANSAFYDCSSLTSVVIPSSTKYIYNGAFYGCTSLTSVTFKDTTTWYRSANGVDYSKTNVTNATNNATYFKSTYSSCTWEKR